MIFDSSDLQIMRDCCRDDAAFERLQALLNSRLTNLGRDAVTNPVENVPVATNQVAIGQQHVWYEAILGVMPDRVFLVNRNGDNLDFKGTEEDSAHGVERETLVGTNLRQFLPPADAQRCLEAIRRALDADTLQTVEYQIPKAWEPHAGELRDYEVRLVKSGDEKILAIERDITDWKRAEERLRQAEVQYRSIFEAINDGLIINDPETGVVVEANPTCCKMHGYTREEFIGAVPKTFIHPSSYHLFEEYVATIKAGKPFRCRAIDVRKDGTPFHVEVLGTSFNYLGKPHLLAVIRDITEQVEAEAALKQSEARNRALVDAIPDFVFRIHADGTFLDVSTSRGDDLILAPAECIGRTVESVLPPDIAQPWMHHIGLALQTKELQIVEYQILVKGSWRDREARIVVAGEREVVVFMRDITERKQAERARDRERRLFADGPVIVFRWTVAEGWPVDYVSANITQFGYAPSDFTSRRLVYADIVDPDDVARVDAEVNAAIAAGRTAVQQDYRIRRADGSVRWVYDLCGILRNELGEVIAYEGYVMDITERKRAEEALRESEEKFSKAFRASPAAMTLTTLAEARLMDVNDSFLEASGYTRDEVIGRTIPEIGIWLEDATREKMRQTLQAMGTIRNLETAFRRKSGDVGVMLFSAEIITFKGMPCVLAVIMDITDRKQAEAALEQSEARNRAFLNAIPDLMFRISRDGTYLDCKADQDRDFAVPPDQMVGQKITAVLPSDVAQQRMYYVEQTLQTGEIQVYEYQLYNHGELRDYEARIVVSGQDEVLAIMRDITARKRTEAQLQANAERERLLGQIALQIHRSLNLDQILMTTVEEVRQFLGVDRVFIGQVDANWEGRILAESAAPEWGSILAWISNDFHLREIRALFSQGQTQAIDDTTTAPLSPVLREYYADCQIRASLGVPILLEGNQFFAVLVAQQCDAPRHWSHFEIELMAQLSVQVAIAVQRAEFYQQVQTLNASLEQQVQERTAQLQQSMQELQELGQMKDEFLHAVSHDLRTPVMGMLMVLKNLQNKAGETAVISRSVLDRMVLSCDRQINMINSLLEAHSAEIRGINLQCEPLSLSELVGAIAEDLDALVSQYGATLVNQVAANLPLVNADHTQIRRVFENLITNALKHNPPGLQITLKATVEDDMMRCCVEDNGVGMSQQECETLFERYAQGSRSRRSAGIGLGLYVCRQIITAHGGIIGAISTTGEGATFWFTLPLTAA